MYSRYAYKNRPASRRKPHFQKWYNVSMTTLTITLPDERLTQLQKLAEEAGIAPEELVQANIETWLASQSDSFAHAAQYVLEKNRELYRRLA